MARSEARLSVSVWTDPDFLALTPTAQRMFMFLLSQPDLAHDGVIALRERRWSKSAASLTIEQVGIDLDELHTARFVVIDEDAEELLVRSFIRRDKVYRQPNVLRAAADHLGVVTSHVILAAIAAELRRVATAEDIGEASATIVTEMLAAIEGAIGNPSPDPSGKGSGNPSAGTPGERGVVTAVVRASPDPRSSEPRTPEPHRPPPAAGPRATRSRDAPPARGTRLPDDFAVTPDMVAWASDKTPQVDGRHETEKFVNYWSAVPGAKGRKTDWAATWRNWMLSAAERRPGNALRLADRSRASPRGTNDIRVEGALALSERLAAEEAM